jgi:benzoyl-CoA reductase/2-hydroxyglutaryl-CoA dehydratase subunit BcrC/BadD/HgdB
MVLAKEEGKKVVYVSFPPILQIGAPLSLASKDIYCSSPDIVLSNTLNLLFNKINPVLETAEKNGLAPSIAFCSYLQTRFGAIVKGIVPMPDLLIPSCFLCDLTPATDGLLHEIYDIPVAYIDNMLDVRGERWPDHISRRKVKYFATGMRNAVEKFSQVTGCHIPESDINHAVNSANRLNSTSRQIQQLRQADPLPLGQNDYQLASSLVYTGNGLLEGPGALSILRDEVEKRGHDGIGIAEKGTPRVMVVMVPHDPAFGKMIEDLGLAACVTASVATPGGAQPSAYTSLWENVADLNLRARGANYSSLAYILQLKELAGLWQVDGIVFFRHYSCRQYSIFPLKAKEVIEEELAIPVMLLEGDYCDFRSYNTLQMRTKLETFAEILKTRKAVRQGIT